MVKAMSVPCLHFIGVSKCVGLQGTVLHARDVFFPECVC